MKISHDIDLSQYTTMGVGGRANNLIKVNTLDQLIESLLWVRENKSKFFILGGGSNTIFTDKGYSGIIILNRIKLKPKFEIINHIDHYSVVAGAGEIWDNLVQFSVENGLTGIEALSLIPGTVGAAPVQNIGAYGQQVSDAVYELEAVDTKSLQVVKFKPEDCGFSYRSSKFNSTEKGRYVIVSVKFKLQKANYRGKIYKDVENYLINNKRSLNNLTPAQIREAVINIRSNKLPNPEIIANSGSFFKNPIISEDQFIKLKLSNPEIVEKPQGWSQCPFWRVDNGYKISAGWLVGRAGFSSFYDNELDFGTWPNQDLVLYSKSKRPEYQNLKSFKELIRLKVHECFNILLQQEPEEVVE
ncbi:MAG: UDP-N-acetylmuramate dehydrogenase [Candidatus Saccharimonadales bacterium]